MAERNEKQEKQEKAEAEEESAEVTEVVTERLDEEQARGFWGTETDTTDNFNYTVAGVTSGADVPEAAENKTTAQAEATNPLLQHPLSPH